MTTKTSLHHPPPDPEKNGNGGRTRTERSFMNTEKQTTLRFCYGVSRAYGFGEALESSQRLAETTRPQGWKELHISTCKIQPSCVFSQERTLKNPAPKRSTEKGSGGAVFIDQNCLLR